MSHYHKNSIQKQDKGLTLYNDNNKIINLPGFGNKPFTAEEAKRIQNALSTEIKADLLQSRPAPGGELISYLQGEESIKIANELFGVDGWSFKIVEMHQDTDATKDVVYYLFTAHVRIILMDGSFKENVGCCSTRNIKEISNAKKSAITDALKRCLKLFGPAFGNNLSNLTYNKQITAESQHLKKLKLLEDSERTKRAYQAHSENYKLQQSQKQQQQQQQQLTPSPQPHLQTTTVSFSTTSNKINNNNNTTNISANIKIENIQSNNVGGSSPPEATVPYNNLNHNHNNNISNNQNVNDNNNNNNINNTIFNRTHKASPNSYHPYLKPPTGDDKQPIYSSPKSSSTPIPFPILQQPQPRHQQQQQLQQQQIIEEPEEIFSLDDSFVNIVGTY